jgi:uncharacterized RDD family membrane protein YckC
MDMVSYGPDWVCAGCKPGFFQRLQQGEAPHQNLAYAGFWLRFAAKLIDAVILYIAQVPINSAFGISMTGQAGQNPLEGGYFLRMGMATSLNLVVGIAFTVFFLGRFGATPGKMALKLKVVRPTGAPISYAQALGRYLSEIVSSLTCLVGYLLVAFDAERRALHDRIASTRVIRNSSAL